jgi:site-specific DNA-methyltransferase (adenine-specific)
LPSVEVKAGVCYFLWDANYIGECDVTTVRGNENIGPINRNLGEYDVFVRDARALTILRKVIAKREQSVNTILARDKEFGWTSNFDGFHTTQALGDIPLHFVRKTKRGVGYIAKNQITKSVNLVDTWKVLVPQAGSDGGQRIPDPVLGKSLLATSPSVCTQSFLFFYLKSKEEAESVQSYYCTKFLRFLVSLRKLTQHATHSTYTWVPMQTWDRTWTDAMLYEKYGITADEQAFIESQIKEMKLEGGDDD